MAKLSSSIIAFAAGDNETLKLMEGYQDYWHQYQAENVKNGHKHTFATTNAQTGQPITFAEKEQALNAAMIRYIEKHSGLSFSSTPIEQAITHPLVAWFAVNLVSQMIDAVLPETILDSIAEISEVRQIGLGDTAIFDIKPRDLFPVSKSGRLGMRVAEIHKGYNGQTTLNPEMRTVTVGVSLFRLLTGQESLADFTVKVMRSIETDMSRDVYNAFSTAMAALSTGATGLKVAGYSQKDLVKLAQKVESYMGGASPMVLGTKYALSQILPDDANYRYSLDNDGDYVKLGYMRTISGINTLEIPQRADWFSPFATVIPDSNLFIVAPGTDKLIKVVLGGATISNTSGLFDSSTLTQDATIYKAWVVGVVTSSVAGLITL